MERRLLAEYEGDLELILRSLAPGKIEAAAALASVPALIRGYGHVKQANALKAAGERSAACRAPQRAGRRGRAAGRRVDRDACRSQRFGKPPTKTFLKADVA